MGTVGILLSRCGKFIMAKLIIIIISKSNNIFIKTLLYDDDQESAILVPVLSSQALISVKTFTVLKLTQKSKNV